MGISRGVLFVFIVVGYMFALFFGGAQRHNSNVSTSPEALLTMIVFGLLALLWPRHDTVDNPSEPVSLWQRFWAANIDFCVAMFILFPPIFLVQIATEFFATGEWLWSFNREEPKFRDLVMVPAMISLFCGIYYYFYKHPSIGRATPGQYILGYRIAPAKTGDPKYGYRVFGGALAMSFSVFVWLFTLDIKDGVYAWDRNSNTRAINSV